MDKFYKVYNTVLNMLKNRGYESVPEIDYNTFINMKRPDLTIITKTKPDAIIKQGPIIVFFPEEEKVGIKTIKTYYEEMIEQDIKRGIIVVKSCVTSFAKNEIGRNDIYLETFEEDSLIFDITTHELVPKHILLTQEEKVDILKKYKAKESQFPKLSINDPVSRYYDFKKLDLIKIVRPSETAGFYTNYRIVA